MLYNIYFDIVSRTMKAMGMQFQQTLLHNYNMQQSREGFEYIEGDDYLPVYAKGMICCGQVVGWLKAWLPCIGCFCCCCDSPYISIPQGLKGVRMRFKKYLYTLSAGLHYINPLTDEIAMVDCRINVVALTPQRLMTRDNISITVDSCIYYHIAQPHLTVFRVEGHEAALIKITGGVIKNTVAAFTFQELLQKKAEITEDVEKQVQPVIKDWGINIDNICLKNFGISAELERQLVSAPIARRNAESKIINAQGQVQIAKLLGQRSLILDSKTAIQVRYLQTLKGLARNATSRMLYRSM